MSIPTREKVNILVVDDQPSKLLVFNTILEELNQNVVAVSSGAEALQQVLGRDFAVILLDVNMPDMDGYETAALIRKRKRSAHVPIIFVTSYADEIHSIKGYSLGAADYVLAPVAPEILRTKVKVFVELFRMAEQAKLHANQRIALVREQAAREAAERAAEALRRSEERFRLASEAVTGFIYEVDLASGRATLSPGVVSLLGFRQEESQKPGWWERRVHPEDRPRVREYESQPEQSRQYRSEYRVRHRDGYLITVWDQGIVVRDEAGVPQRLVGNVVDITERKVAEEALAESNRRKDEFLAMLAHELRNPLAPIRNSVQVLQTAEVTPALQRKCHEMIDRQVVHMARLLDDLLDMSRITRGTLELRRERFRFGDVIRHAVETTEPMIESKGQQLTVDLLEDPLIDADAARLSQVFSNLLHNAAKYTPANGKIDVVAAEDHDDLVVTVRDTGIGVPADMLPRIFEPFVQVDRPLDRLGGGLGIGLTLAQRLVEMHGGGVWAASGGPGAGSVFTVRLPARLRVTEAKLLRVPAPMRGPTQHPRRVLVVDDIRDNADSLAFMLHAAGHQVRAAYDGSEALQVADTFHPEVALLDLGMPELSGYEVARKIRAEDWGKNCTLIAITGWGRERDRQLTREAGFDHHLIKPFDAGTLAELLERPIRSAPVVTS
jgi:PAS domain S-box-containing protein